MFSSGHSSVNESAIPKMDIQRSRNGYYTLTFINKHNLSEGTISRDFNSVGRVCNIVQTNNRIFIRYREKEEAERAILTFAQSYEVEMAKNNKGEHDGNRFNYKGPRRHPNFPSTSDLSTWSYGMEKFKKRARMVNPDEYDEYMMMLMSGVVNEGNQIPEAYYLILGNIPKSFTLRDVTALVEEASPVYISPFESTKVFHSKFCQIVVSSYESLVYLVDKLNGFVISGERLIAVELKNLMEWREKMA